MSMLDSEFSRIKRIESERLSLENKLSDESLCYEEYRAISERLYQLTIERFDLIDQIIEMNKYY